MFIDLKIFASPGESGSTQETCLPTPSSKRWACVEAIGGDNVYLIKCCCLNVYGGSGAAHFNFQVFSFTSGHCIESFSLQTLIQYIIACSPCHFGELFSCFCFGLRFIFSIYLFAPPCHPRVTLENFFVPPISNPFPPFHSNIAPFHMGIIINMVEWSKISGFCWILEVVWTGGVVKW